MPLCQLSHQDGFDQLSFGFDVGHEVNVCFDVTNYNGGSNTNEDVLSFVVNITREHTFKDRNIFGTIFVLQDEESQTGFAGVCISKGLDTRVTKVAQFRNETIRVGLNNTEFSHDKKETDVGFGRGWDGSLSSTPIEYTIGGVLSRGLVPLIQLA